MAESSFAIFHLSILISPRHSDTKMNHFKALTSYLGVDNPTILTALSSLFTLIPCSSPLFPFLTLPALLDPGDTESSRSFLNILKKVLAVWLGSTGGSLISTWGILPSRTEQTFAQLVFSLCIAIVLGLTSTIQNKVVEGWLMQNPEDWLLPLYLAWYGREFGCSGE